MKEWKLNEQISVLRRKMGVSQEDLARALGVTGQSVSKWENGLCCPDIQLLPEIADYFHVSIDELMGHRMMHVEYTGSQEVTDALFERAVAIAREAGKASVPLLQRKLCIGYAMACSLIGQMAERGYIDTMGDSYHQWKETDPLSSDAG